MKKVIAYLVVIGLVGFMFYLFNTHHTTAPEEAPKVILNQTFTEPPAKITVAEGSHWLIPNNATYAIECGSSTFLYPIDSGDIQSGREFDATYYETPEGLTSVNHPGSFDESKPYWGWLIYVNGSWHEWANPYEIHRHFVEVSAFDSRHNITQDDLCTQNIFYIECRTNLTRCAFVNPGKLVTVDDSEHAWCKVSKNRFKKVDNRSGVRFAGYLGITTKGTWTAFNLN